jgi:hypothetical protein
MPRKCIAACRTWFYSGFTMEKEKTTLNSLEDLAGSLLWFFALIGLLISAITIARHLFKWGEKVVDWSMTSESKFRYFVLCPLIVAVAPFMFAWFVIKQAAFLISQLFLRILNFGCRILSWIFHST